MAVEDMAQEEHAKLPAGAKNNAAKAKSDSIDDTVSDFDKPVGLARSIGQFELWDWAKIVGFGTLSFAYIANILDPITAAINIGSTIANYIIGHYVAYREGLTKNNVHGEIQLANVVAPISSTGLKYINSIKDNTAALAGIGLLGIPAWTILYNFIATPIRKYSPSQFIKNIHKIPGESAENAKKRFKGVSKVAFAALIPYMAIVSFVPLRYQLPVIETMGPIFRYFTRKEEKKTETPDDQSNVKQFPQRNYAPQQDKKAA